MGSSVSSVPRELAANGTTGPAPYTEPAWKQELNEKIAAARARRQGVQQQPSTALSTDDASSDDSRAKASRIAAAVAARYAQAPSYKEYLASEVRAAMMAAVAAQAAADHARAAADAMYAEMNGSEQAALEQELPALRELPTPAESPAPQDETLGVLSAEVHPQAWKAEQVHARRPEVAPRVDHRASGFHYGAAAPASATPTGQSHKPAAPSLMDPIQEALITPATPLPAKLLEFPRELIAARKARPRHAEGPLRDAAPGEPGQLRIFEVDHSAVAPGDEVPPRATEWSSIRLDAYPEENYGRPYGGQDASIKAAASHTAVTAKTLRPSYNGAMASAYSHASRSQVVEQASFTDVAGIADRLMAGIVDAALVGIAFVLFVLVFTTSTVHMPTGKSALFGAIGLLAALYLAYQLLFFTFADATPGMLYARIALCTFDDDNPTRPAMRKRIFALVLAAAPLGLGFLYALFDEDHLGWHDRMTGMYQRSYK